jgi:hypothetical protein
MAREFHLTIDATNQGREITDVGARTTATDDRSAAA